jgi:SAM-dependent methyltransferase/uncharacterized coiled-coil protein SlyX
MFQWAGFDAAGLELSPWVVDFSRQTFDIPTLLGPIEDQAIEPSSLDVICLMDVLEHLPDPTRTMQHCLTLLKPDGLLLIQTPLFLETKTYELMQEEDDRFLEQLKHDEHLLLFSQQAIRRFFRRLGADHLIFEPAIFAHYDMFVVVSRCDLPVYCTADAHEALSATASGRLIRALLDLDDQMRQAHRLSVAKQRDLQLQAHTIHQQLMTQQANHTALETEYNAQRREIEHQRREIEHQRQEMTQLEANKRHWKRMANDLQSQVKTLQQRYVALEAEHAAQGQVIEHQRQHLTRFQDETNRLQQHMQDMHEQLQAITQAHAGLQGRFETLTQDHEHLGMQLHLAQDRLHIAQRTRVYRLLRRLGRWKFLESHMPASPDS